jgi:hypothetical protein
MRPASSALKGFDECLGRVSFWEALCEIDGAVLIRETRHPANNRLSETV